jgi:hypothetical protein
MAANHRWLPRDIRNECLKIWQTGKWLGRDQTIGEFAALRSAYAPDDDIFAPILNAALSKTVPTTKALNDLRIGISFAAVNLWSDPKLKPVCHKLILRLFPLATNEIASAIMDIFRVSSTIPPDHYTIELLESVIATPRMLADYFLLTRALKSLLADGLDPQLVARVANAILDEGERAAGSHGNRWTAHSSYLTQLAMTLQKTESSQSVGLELFERLMDLGAYEADQVLRPPNYRQ